MGDMGEIFNAYKEYAKEKRHENLKKTIEEMDRLGLKYRQLSQYHFRVGHIDFWPSTGKFINLKTKKRGHGFKKVLAQLKDEENQNHLTLNELDGKYNDNGTQKNSL